MVAALADSLVDGALDARRHRGEDLPLGADARVADPGPVGGEDVHRRHATERPVRRRAGPGWAAGRSSSLRWMPPEQQTLAATTPSERAIGHGDGPLLVLGAAGTGKTELLARRLAQLARRPRTGRPRSSLLASTRARRGGCANAAAALLEGAYEELWIGTLDELAERLLREHSEAAGLDPFFDVLGSAERLAMLLDRLDDLPLRRHEIRGNPAGLLARLLARIDALKAERIGPTRLAERAREATPAAGDDAGREAAPRELEFAELYTAHDRILAATGSLDRGDVFLALECLLVERPDVRRELAGRFRSRWSTSSRRRRPAQRALLAALAHRATTITSTRSSPEGELAGWFRDLHPGGDVARPRPSLPRAGLASGAAATSAPRRRRWPARSST